MIRNIHPEVVRFIEQRLGILPNISEDAPLEITYGMAGLDSWVFYDDFVTTFGIELPDGFDISHYTSPDGGDLRAAIKSLFSKKYREQHWYVDLTVRDPEEMRQTKKWTTRRH